ncbi:hypothetical protein [Burkholderia sp. LMG 13014]|uniref:hypothetical protein n=1 Tax=Burkholderia sp. LMG 13014 TaxID=2709306 RepID=UPI001964CEC0|nr:hypothetical protein [Burkholderia sp. LMG 13014]
MKKNNDHTALEMHEEEFDFFKISKPKEEPETHQEASEQEPTLKSVLLEPIKDLYSDETKESLIELLGLMP